MKGICQLHVLTVLFGKNLQFRESFDDNMGDDCFCSICHQTIKRNQVAGHGCIVKLCMPNMVAGILRPENGRKIIYPAWHGQVLYTNNPQDRHEDGRIRVLGKDMTEGEKEKLSQYFARMQKKSNTTNHPTQNLPAPPPPSFDSSNSTYPVNNSDILASVCSRYEIKCPEVQSRTHKIMALARKKVSLIQTFIYFSDS